MQATTNLTETQWQVADAIARTLVLAEADVNELRKVISYLRAYADQDQAGKKFFDYLKTLVRNGGRVGHSQQTTAYYTTIEQTCSQYLGNYRDDVATMLHLLGWAARLMQYYKQAGPIAETPPSTIRSEREAEIQAIAATHEFQVGQVLDAVVMAVKGNRVTYEILGTIKLTEKEPKKAAQFTEGQQVKVEILDLKEEGGIRKVKCVD